MRLTIISHTEHYLDGNGQLLGLGPTVTEINHLLDIFDSITHVAMLHDDEPPQSAIPYVSDRIRFVSIPVVGGKTWNEKLKILKKASTILQIVKTELGRSDCFQFRAPTGIGVFIIPYLILFSKKKGWFKYAGNWMQKSVPPAFRLQRWLLKIQDRPVTINGRWLNQPEHCLSFENPCLTEVEISDGKLIASTKEKVNHGINLCFVGRLEEAKGIGLLIRAIAALTDEEKEQIEVVHIVGEGSQKHDYIEEAKKTHVSFEFYGLLSRTEVHNIYKQSHAILLPSASEGFPKVIAEAMNYGCIPIVSNISSIGHYVKDKKNGFLLNSIDSQETLKTIREFLQLSSKNFYAMTSSELNRIERFSYAYYNSRISNEIL